MRSVEDRERARLRALLDQATTAMGTALTDARAAHEDLTRLLNISQRRHLDGVERACYAAIEHSERDAAKRYLAARHWRDTVSARLRDLRLREDDAAGPAA